MVTNHTPAGHPPVGVDGWVGGWVGGGGGGMALRVVKPRPVSKGGQVN